MVECQINILEQPITRVKFRTDVQSRCQNKELILGRTSQTVENFNFFPTVKVVPSSPGGRLRVNTFVRMSLVDIRSSPANIMDHFHRIVDCKNSPGAAWSVEKRMDEDGRAVFNELGIVKSLETEKVTEVTERMICRREEVGDDYARNNKWEKTQITNKAEQQCRETSSSRLKLCFEAFLKDESSRIVKVCEPVLSEEIHDLNSVSNGEFSVQKMSLCSDFVEGGAEVMIFTNKVNYSRSSFFADFFQLKDPEDETSGRVWEKRVPVPDCQLHTVGANLGGLYFTVPMYNRSSGDQPQQLDTEVTCSLQLVKTSKNNMVQARSDRLMFTYKPRRVIKGVKRPAERIEHLMKKKLPKEDFPVFVPTPLHQFWPLQPVTPLMSIVEEPKVMMQPQETPSMVISPATPDMTLHNISPAHDTTNNNNNNDQMPPFYGSSPQARSPQLISRSPAPQHLPELTTIMDDFDIQNLLSGADNFGTDNNSLHDGIDFNIVIDGHKKEIKDKSKTKSEGKETTRHTAQGDIVQRMSKLNM